MDNKQDKFQIRNDFLSNHNEIAEDSNKRNLIYSEIHKTETLLQLQENELDESIELSIQNAKKWEGECIHNLDLNYIIKSKGKLCLTYYSDNISNYSTIELYDECNRHIYTPNGECYYARDYQNYLLKSDLELAHKLAYEYNYEKDKFYRCLYCYKILYCICESCSGCKYNKDCDCPKCRASSSDDNDD